MIAPQGSGGPSGPVTSFTYDYLGRQTGRILPVSVLSETFEFEDAALAELAQAEASVGLGQLMHHVSFEGKHAYYLYDNTPTGGGRIVGEYYYDASFSGTPSEANAAEATTYTYDAFGRQKKVEMWESGSVTYDVTYTYDAEGRVTKESHTTPSQLPDIEHQYDNRGRLIATFTNDTKIDYGYDQLDRLKTVTEVKRNGTIVNKMTEYYYDANGNLDAMVHADNSLVDYEYDNLNRLTSIVHVLPDGTGAVNWGWETDPLRTVISEDYYRYDRAGRRDRGYRIGADSF